MASTPNDPLFSQQWGLHQSSDVDIDAPEAWHLALGDPGLIVAVLDTGADLNHPDLAANLIPGFNFIEMNNDVQDKVTNAHGTHVHGIIGAVSHNSLGVSGVARQISLLTVKVFGPRQFNNGQFGAPYCPNPVSTSAQMIQAIDYAVGSGAKIINGSFGSDGEVILDTSVRLAIEGAADKALFIFAAGNTGDEVEAVNRVPCGWASPNIICVGAADASGQIWPDSNYSARSVDLVAPGVSILSTNRSDCLEVFDGNCLEANAVRCSDTIDLYRSLTGTSMSTAFVSGVAALVMSRNPENPNNPQMSGAKYIRRIKEAVLLAAQPLPSGDLETTTVMGGMVNARLSLDAFGDSFEDATPSGGYLFFRNEPTRSRWAATTQPNSTPCSVEVVDMPNSGDRSVRMTFNGLTSWTSASYKADLWEHGNSSVTLVLRVASPDDADLTGRSGRIGIGIIGQTGMSLVGCPQGGVNYNEAAYGGLSVGGIDLATRRPFLFFSPPYNEPVFFSPITLTGVRKISISIFYTSNRATLRITNSATGAKLFPPGTGSSETVFYPSNWDFSGTITPVFAYYGTANGTAGTLLARSMVGLR